jgi:tRNA-specific 2-thiouridylase
LIECFFIEYHLFFRHVNEKKQKICYPKTGPVVQMKRKKVVVAMSGGVDSSVAAALLKDQGHEVIGLTMNLFSLPKELCRSDEVRSCCGWKATEDAHDVALRLGIPHYVADFRQEFEKRVISDFCREYGRGRTPNPCIRCNEHIKFKLFLAAADRLGGEAIATGQYARVGRSRATGRYLLKKGTDGAKDQSYFLYPLSQAQLSRTLLPLGGLTKSEVRGLAKKWGLPVAGKPESQEICFVPLGNYPDFLRERTPQAFVSGQIKDLTGRVVGRHRGIAHFTIGQRRGMGIAAAQPLYVIAINAASHTVIVGGQHDLSRKGLVASQVHWIAIEGLDKPLSVKAKIRYRHEAARAVVMPLSPHRVRVEFETPQRAITPGQSVVFYVRDVVIGGGVIDRPAD